MRGRATAHRLDGLVNVLLNAGSPDDLFQAVCALGCEAVGAVGVAVLARRQSSVRAIAASPPSAEGEAPSWLNDLGKCYSQMLAENSQTVLLTPGPNSAHGVFVPLLNNEHGSLALAAYILGGRQVRLQSVADTLHLLRTNIFLIERASQGNGKAQTAGGENGDASSDLLDVVDIVSEVQSCTRFFEATTTLCAEAAAKFECRRAALGIVRNGHVKAAALDQMESFSRGTRSVRRMEEVMQEALDQDRMILFSTVEGEEPEPGVITRAARELAATSNIRRVLTIPLRTQEGIAFIMLFMMDGEEFTTRRLDALSLVCRLAAPRLHDLRQAEELPLKKAWRYLILRSEDIFGPRRTVLKLAGSLIGLLLFFSLIIPGTVIVSAPLAIEGVHSYTHTAPMDSYLCEVMARPGDEVKAGDILGRLDATEIDLEIAALEAQQNIHESQADQYLQEGKDAEAAMARLEAERAGANLAWARRRLAMTELKSGVDGFLVSEDMLSRLGQPVRRGQELFEVTDTASLRVVAHVNETDISDINRTMASGTVHGQFTLTAYPDLQIPFTVERIHPYAEVAGTNNGFEIRGHIDDVPHGLVLRPGMEGYARIEAGKKPLLTLWTRKLVNKVRLLAWRWL